MPRTRSLRVEPLEDRLAPAAGDLDPTFGIAGIERFTSGKVAQLAVVPDGRILALVNSGTNSLALERFGPDGAPDTTFGTGGVAALPGVTGVTGSHPTLTALPDGGAFVGRTVPDDLGSPVGFALVRVTAAGGIDPTFGTGGTALVPTQSAPDFDSLNLSAVVAQPDGRVLLAGDATPNPIIVGQPPRYYHLVVARLTAAGQLDSSFGSGGTAVLTDPTGHFTSLNAGGVALQPDGRIVLAGNASATPVGQRGQVYAPVAIRLTSNGQLDPTFGTGGFTAVTFPQQDRSGIFQTVSVLADGRVLLAGEVVQTSGIVGGAARLTSDGRLDPSFGAGGVAITAQFVTISGGTVSGSPFLNAAIDPSGRVVFDTAATTGPPGGYVSNTIFRLTADGAVDAGFGTNGQVSALSLPGLTTVNPGDLNLEPGLAVQPNGNILLGGTDQATNPSSNSGLIVRLIGSNPPSGFVPAVPGTVMVGGAGGGTVQVLNPTNGTYAPAGTMTIYNGFVGNVRTAVADVNGDGTPDYITAVGPGGPPGVSVFDGKTGSVLADFLAFESGFTGGVFVAAADLDGDGKAEVVAAPDQGGGPRVVVFSVAGGAATMRASFFGIDDPNFRGGARVAVGDVNHDGTADLAVAAGFLGGPRIALFNGKSLFGGNPTRLVNDFFAFPGPDATTLRNGAFVSIGDVSGDGFADLVFGGGPGGAPRVFVLSGQQVSAGDVAGAQASPVANFFVANNSADRGGVRVAVKDADGDNKADLVIGSGAGAPANVRVYLGKDFTTSAEPTAFQDIGVFGGAPLPGGVFVG